MKSQVNVIKYLYINVLFASRANELILLASLMNSRRIKIKKVSKIKPETLRSIHKQVKDRTGGCGKILG